MKNATALEIIATSLEDVKASCQGGAQRVELLSAFHEGGLTPPEDLIRGVLGFPVEVAVMLRPHSRSFRYCEEDYMRMRRDLLRMEALGVSRVVLGALNSRGEVDSEFLKRLFYGVQLQATFHRAIDVSSDLFKSLEKIAEIENFTHVLTSGGGTHCANHLSVLKAMMGGPLRIIVGSGLSLGNLPQVLDQLQDMEFDLHFGRAARGGRLEDGVEADIVREIRRTIGIYNRRSEACC